MPQSPSSRSQNLEGVPRGQRDLLIYLRRLIALAQVNRLSIYRRLLAAWPEGITRSRLMDELNLTKGRVTTCTKWLLTAGLIEVRRNETTLQQIEHKGSDDFLCVASAEAAEEMLSLFSRSPN
jgi:hypothetical protein